MQPEETIQSQRQIGTDVEKLISNYKKDSKDRKTSAYYEKRIVQLEDLKTQFELNHDIIIVYDEAMDHDYIKNEYYQQVISAINKYVAEFKNELNVSQNKNATQSGPAIRQHVLVSPERDVQKKEALPLVKQLLRKEKALQRALLRNIQCVLDEANTRQTQFHYQLQLTLIQDYLVKLQENHEVMWQNVTDNIIEECTYDDIFDYEFKAQEIMAMLQQQLASNDRTEQSVHNTPGSLSPQIKLPEISLPKFNGDPLQWVTFKDLYVQMIHSQPFGKAQKMFYLSTNLSGEPLNLIKHIPTTMENYDSAWELLTNRYDNKRLLVTSLLNKLMSIPTIKQSTSTALKMVHDITKECIHGLKAQSIPIEHWDAIIVHLTLRKLDENTRTAFEQSVDNSKRLLSLQEVLQFLEHRFLSMDTALKTSGVSTLKTCAPFVKQQPSTEKCVICKAFVHPLKACKLFLAEKVTTRWTLAKKHNLCTNCLTPGHYNKNCTSRNCLKCDKRHHTLLHSEANKNISQKPNENTTPVSLLTKQYKPSNYVILGTARIKIASTKGPDVECRAILDPGSQVTLITDKVAKQLGVRIKSAPIKVEGVGRQKSTTKYRAMVHIKSRINEFSAKLEAHVLPNIVCDQPSQHINISEWSIPENLSLADPEFFNPGPIDCLLGAEIFFHLLTAGQIKLMDGQPVLQNTTLGWIVSGKIHEPQLETVTCSVLTNKELDEKLSKFWDLEEIDDSTQSLSTDEKLSESHFVQHTKHLEDGRLIVRLPLKEDTSLLGESKYMAYNRFLNLEKRLEKNPEIKEQYTKFMEEYIDLNHMSQISPVILRQKHYFIPHHHVLKPDSSSTKLRVVFDASAKTTSGVALNDIMHTGRVVQSELFSILLRFRLPRFVIKTDIEKMYRQILIDPEDRQLQLIMWRSSPLEEIRYYQLNTVTYGTRSAPFLATRCLLKLAEENATTFQLGSMALKNDFYVDDGLTGSDSLNEAIEIKDQLIKILGAAGMKLKKWTSNHSKILDGISDQDQEISLDLANDGIKTMGLMWLPSTDQFIIKGKVTVEAKISKRTVLSDLAHIFDPLGLVSPVVVTAKIFLQQLWQRNLSWDEPLPEDLRIRWVSFREELYHLDNTKIPRRVVNNRDKIQLHAFSDASEQAYGAAIYIRTINKDKTVMVRLLCSKSRVAPIKMQTIPRLELCAALLAAELMDRVKTDLNFHNKPLYYWTDSQIVLAWLNQKSSSFQTFVAHRVSKIQRLTLIEQWRHVRTQHNPADVLSRGIMPRKLPTCNIWYYGPLFLQQEEHLWPMSFNKESCVIDNSECKRAVIQNTTLTGVIHDASFIYNINSRNDFQTLQRVIGYVLRFIKKCQGRQCGIEATKELSPTELNDSLNVIIKEVQKFEFKDDIKTLQSSQCLPKSNRLCHLTPFLDDIGIMRVGGRIHLSSLPYDAKHQMILPYNDSIVKLLMEDIHKRNLHLGTNALIMETKQRFWPIKVKIMARSVVHNCTRCTRFRPTLYNQIMGQLPAQRVEPSRPFLNAGVDYCGPLKVHYKVRGKHPQKAYIAVFCCFSTKAVHLELVTDLTTNAFIGALKRFMSRRGHCKTLFCDNATNFVGAKNQLAELHEAIFSENARSSVINFCSRKGIEFKFIPPRAPHFGGLWEAAVKSAKHLLMRNVATASLTYEELETVVTEVEAILNSRPLTPISSDPNDLTALTPGHFIIGEPLTSPVDIMTTPIQCKLRDRWQLVSQVKHQFWDRWSKEYLSELQSKHRWKGPIKEIKTDTLVIIKEDNVPVLQWPLGRITTVYKGEDGIVRVVDVKTSKGIFKRPVHRLAPLFPEEEHKASNVQNTVSTTQDEVKEINTRHQDDLHPTKRRRLLSGFNCLVLLALLLPLAAATTTTFTPIRSNPGIHFENIGTVKRSVSNWQLVVYYDLQPLYKESNTLHDWTRTLHGLCEKLNATASCSPLINHFLQVENEIDTGFKFLPTRTKRGAVNIVGNIANSLFGVLDSDYADKMTATINAVKANEQHLNTLLKNQTSVIDATLNIIKQDQLLTKAKFEELDNEIRQIVVSPQERMKAIQSIIMICIQLLAISSRLHKIHSSIMNLLVDTHHGRVNPSILTPQQLAAETQKIRANLPPGLSMPISSNNIQHLYSLTDTNAIVSDQHIVCTINIPLVDHQNFDLFYLTPVPQAINKTLVFVPPTTRLLALNDHRDEYFPITDASFQDCTKVPTSTFICPNIRAVYQRGADICKCEFHLFHNESYPQCKLKRSFENTLWQNLHHHNQWIVATIERIQLSTVCNHNTVQITLNGTGLLQLGPTCTIKTEDVNIRGQQVLHTNVNVSHTSIGVSVSQLNQMDDDVKLHPYYTQLLEVDQLQRQLKSSNLLELPNTLEEAAHHSVAIGYGALVLVILVVIYLIIKWLLKFRKTTTISPPQPNPRRQSLWRVSTT